MASVQAVFDGKVFVPTEKVDVPPGTKVEVIILREAVSMAGEDRARWEEVKRQIDASEPHFPTLDEAMNYLRKRS